MDFLELKQKVTTELLSRGLANPNIRLRALEKVELFLKAKHKEIMADATLLKEFGKDKLKMEYGQYKGNALNGAESSVINEVYNQL